MHGGPSPTPWTARGGGPDLAPLLRDLTEPQKAAVLHTHGPLLVLAAAGSGKTRVITRRIAHLIGTGVKPWQILALTFTNKAAGEMRERVHALLGEGAPSRGLTVTTFHALCARLLRKYAEPAGLKPDFTIYDADDQASLCKRVLESLQLSTSNFPPRSVLAAISRAKNELIDAPAFAARATDWSAKNVAKVYTAYTRALREASAVDFDDLLMLTARLLERDAGVRAEVQARWRFLLVDEYQDTNHAQFRIASLIAGGGRAALPAGGETDAPGPNFCVVGDPDQAIYGWRGADISNILEFEEHYPRCRVITLGENFRSTAPILAAADALIRRNARRKHKDLFTSRAGGEKPEAVLCREERHEAALVTDWLRARHEAGAPWRDMAVFYRTNALSRVMEDSLRGAGVPYVIARGTAFYEREEVRHALAYLRVVANPADSVSLARIINTPTRGIGKTTLDALEAHARDRGVPLLRACRGAGEIAGLTPRALPALAKFVAMLDAWGAPLSPDATLADQVRRIIEQSGLRGMYAAQAAASKSDADLERVDNLDELVSSARQFEQEYDPAADAAGEGADPGAPAPAPVMTLLRAFLESVSLVADADAVDPAQGAVTLMTLHAAKGLEFDSVAMIGLEEGLLPHSRAILSPVAGDAELEEERRLCFVGITRAMRRLLMTSAKYRTIRGVPERTVPSRFLADIPPDCMRIADQSEPEDDAWGADTGSFQTRPRRHDADPVSEGLTNAARPTTGIAAQLPIGSKVRHPRFGVGIVQTVQGGANARATIRFQEAGVKTLVLEFAGLTRLP